jgi:hypothetical protein
MLVVRQQQFRALGDDLLRRWLGNHLGAYFPAQLNALTTWERADFLSGAILRARALGITSDAGVCFYATLALLLGPEFDSDLKLPWISAILHDASLRSPGDKIEAAYDEAARYLSTT